VCQPRAVFGAALSGRREMIAIEDEVREAVEDQVRERITAGPEPVRLGLRLWSAARLLCQRTSPRFSVWTGP
jgi:hypothetical protein